MKKFLIFLLITVVPIFACVATTNFLVDPAHRFAFSYVDEMLDVIKDGKNATCAGNFNEREYKRKLASLHKGEHFDYLIFGTSIIMQVSSDMLEGAKVLNLAVSGAAFQDLIAFYEICKDNEITADTVLIGTLPSLLNNTPSETRWKENKPFAERRIASIEETFEEKASSMIGVDLETYASLFDISYFKSAVKALNKLGSDKIGSSTQRDNDDYTYCPEGSMTYSKKIREIAPSEVEKSAKGGSIREEYLSTTSEEFIKVYGTMINELKSNNVKVALLKMPLHQLYYNKVCQKSNFDKLDTQITEVNQTLGVEVLGSYNPASYHLNSSDYIDEGHLQRSAVERIVQKYMKEL